MNNAESGAMSAKSENTITGLGGTILDLALKISSNFTILRLWKLVLKTILRLYDSSNFSDSTWLSFNCSVLLSDFTHIVKSTLIVKNNRSIGTEF